MWRWEWPGKFTARKPQAEPSHIVSWLGSLCKSWSPAWRTPSLQCFRCEKTTLHCWGGKCLCSVGRRDGNISLRRCPPLHNLCSYSNKPRNSRISCRGSSRWHSWQDQMKRWVQWCGCFRDLWNKCIWLGRLQSYIAQYNSGALVGCHWFFWAK